MRSIHKLAGFTAAVAAVAGSLAFGSLARADDGDPAPQSLVEDFLYPGAAQIEAAKHIKLISGDGHITLATCGSADNLIQVESYNDINEAVYCFQVHGPTGLLRLEIPKVFFIWAGDKAVTARVTVNGVENAPITVAANDGESVGAADPKNHGVLLELKV